MDFSWRIVSRTGEIITGEDTFPTPEQREQATLFDLQTPYDVPIEAPYGQNIIGRVMSVAVPDDSILIFKRRTRFSVGAVQESSFKYIIAFEKRE